MSLTPWQHVRSLFKDYRKTSPSGLFSWHCSVGTAAVTVSHAVILLTQTPSQQFGEKRRMMQASYTQ